MTNTPFVADNGFEVHPSEDGSIRVDNLFIGPQYAEALIQFIEFATGIKISEPA